MFGICESCDPGCTNSVCRFIAITLKKLFMCILGTSNSSAEMSIIGVEPWRAPVNEVYMYTWSILINCNVLKLVCKKNCKKSL